MGDVPADGECALAWVRDHSPVLSSFAEQYGETEPFADRTVAVSAPLTPHTGVFVETLRRAGATVSAIGEPGANHAGVVAELDGREGITVHVEPGSEPAAFEAAKRELLAASEPDFVFDDGCALVSTLHAEFPALAADVAGGAEQTTSGITRLESMDDDGVLRFPVYGVNDTPMKRQFDNVHGTGESTLAAIVSTTNTMLSGKTLVVAGYGHCGRGVAQKAAGIGADTVVTEVDPRRALAARMDGHRVMPMIEAAAEADYVVATTGSVDVVRREHFEAMADGAVVASAGTAHEVAVRHLADLATSITEPRDGVTRHVLADGRRIDLLTEGLVVNLAAPGADGNPAEVMDTTFASMFLAAHDVLVGDADLPPGLHVLPDHLDRAVAETKLETTGTAIDEPTDRQRAFAEDWVHEDDHGWS